MERIQESGTMTVSALTRTERVVLEAVWELGDSTSAATHLHVSVETVRTHLRNIREKFGVHSTLQAIALLKKDDPQNS